MVWANTFNRFDPTSPFGGYKESGYGREGGRHGLEAYLDELSEPRRRPQDLQALHRRGVPALASPGALLRRATTRKGRFLANAALASRKDARDAVVAARKAFPRLVRPRRRTTAARCSTGSPR